ncbi:hypothetical protein GALMADRAFT_483435 [Galerina marginata CBS 339.88]|uniref:Uncharacterized protein n=1 Tax=Galerina marginata (strain CBS 339.88) TaxID=685588 RepID=A0A067SZL1_GALM3|nr:hypothetical protein GALMADRAFT_483435 [Galerina marginata CBS 339.88]
MSLSSYKISQVSSLPQTAPTLVPGPYPQQQQKSPKAQRSCSSLNFLRAIAPWLLFMPGLGSLYPAHPQSPSGGGQNSPGQQLSGQYEVPQGINIQHCIETQEWSPGGDNQAPYSSQTKFDLPLSSASLFLIARGPQSGGAVDITTSSEQAQGSVSFSVVVSYSRQDFRDSSKVCRVVRGNGENGVGIFTPENLNNNGNGQLNFHTTITLPEVPAGSGPLPVQKLETDVPNTSHSVGDLRQKVSFDAIALFGSNQGINVQSLSAITGIFRTSNGAITGDFDASSALSLLTSNSPIKVNVGLKNDNNGTQSKLVVRTSNSPLQAAINLSSTSGGGSFGVTTTTSNGQLQVSFPAAPVDSKLQLVASTTNSPAHVSLPPAYEGSFSLSSSPFSAPSLNQLNPPDPSGRGRQRTVQHYQVGGGQLNGNVSWGGDRGQGTVSVRTTLSPSTLDV